jgi:hypothetical protein
MNKWILFVPDALPSIERPPHRFIGPFLDEETTTAYAARHGLSTALAVPIEPAFFTVITENTGDDPPPGWSRTE